jgi:hypothetical protein
MHDIPTMAWVIGALGLAYIAIRVWASRAEEQRRAARDERMAQLFAERDNAPPPSQLPHSLSAVTSDRDGEKPDAPAESKPAESNPSESKEVVKVRCRACKALNDESDKTCKECGAEM